MAVLAQAITINNIHGANPVAGNNENPQAPTSLLTRIGNVVFPILSVGLKVVLGLTLLAANIAVPVIPILMAHAAILGIVAYAAVTLMVIGADLAAFKYCLSNATFTTALNNFMNDGII